MNWKGESRIIQNSVLINISNDFEFLSYHGGRFTKMKQVMPATDQIEQRIKNREMLRTAGFEPYGSRFQCTHSIKELMDKYKSLQIEDVTTETVTVAGRLMAIRGHGKAAFADLVDLSGKVQLHFKADILGENYRLMEWLDLGDIIGIAGSMFRTKRGELTIKVESCTPL